jgi:hypothetical protein
MNTTTRLRTVGALSLAGTPSSVWCFLNHFCIGGHLAHGPYPAQYWVSDCLALACFSSVAVLAVRMRARGKRFLLLGSLLLVLSWIFGGGIGLFAVPLLGGMDVYALAYLVRPSKFEMNGERSAPPNSRSPSALPTPPEIQTPDSLRAPSSGGCG